MNTGRAIYCLVSSSLLAVSSATAVGASSHVDLAIKAGLRPDPAASVPHQEAPRVPTVHQNVVVIDFEDFNLGGNLFLDTAETLVFPNVGGSGVTVTIEGHDDVRIYDLYQYAGNYGTSRQALIDMDWVQYSNPLGTTISFDPPVNNFSLLAGDYGSDDDNLLTITAFDANGAVIGTDSKPWPEPQYPPFAQLSVNVGGIKTTHYFSGGSYPNSTFIDDLTFTPGTVDAPGTVLPGTLWLSPLVPNPTHNSTLIRFGLPRGGTVELTIYDVRGRQVRELVRNYLPAGEHDITWNLRDERGQLMTNGLYLLRLEVEGRRIVGRLVVLR